MEQMMLSHLIHADEALAGANAMCDVDPLLINERGVLQFYNKEYAPSFQLHFFFIDKIPAITLQ